MSTITRTPRRRIAVDLSPLASDGSNGGSRPFVLGLLSALLAREDAHELHLLVKPEAAEVVRGLEELGAHVHRLGVDDGVSEPRRLTRTRRRLAGPLRKALDRVQPPRDSLRSLGVDTLFSPLGTAAFFEPGLFHVAIAYDFQELDHPSFFSPRERRRRRAFRADLKRCDRVAAISEFTARFAIERLGLSIGRIVVIPPIIEPAVPLNEDELTSRLTTLGLSAGGFLVYPANFWPHKNHARLLQALASLSRREPISTDPIRLVLSGADTTGRREIQGLIDSLELSTAVTLLPYVPDADLIALLQGARALVFPSLYEGFGLPVLEAMQLGTPVACSSLPSLREIGGEAALNFSPESVAEIGTALERIWMDDALRIRLRADGAARAALFSGAASANAHHQLLDPSTGT